MSDEWDEKALEAHCSLHAAYLKGLEAAIIIQQVKVQQGWDGTATMLWNAVQSRIDEAKKKKGDKDT